MTVVDEQELAARAERHDILGLGMRADGVRRGLHGHRTTFLRVAVVAAGVEDAGSLGPFGAAGVVRIEGRPVSRAAAVARVRATVAAAGRTPVSAFSLADLEELAAVEGETLRALLEELRAAGAELVAEAPLDRLHDPRRAIEEVNIAGLALDRLTVHQLPAGDPLVLLRAAAMLQRGVGVIRAFAPLPRLVNPAAPSTGYQDVTVVALARIVADNIPSIQVDWALYGPKLAQVALTMGADDVDGVSPAEGSADGRRRAPLAEIEGNIRAAGQEPLERDGRFDVLRG